MAKGQMRSNKETRKPKADKKAKLAGGADALKAGAGSKPFGDTAKKK